MKIIYDIKTQGLDGKNKISKGKRFFCPTISFHPFKISLFKTIVYYDAGNEELYNILIDKLHEHIQSKDRR